jgi:hypothetical protein
MSIKYVLETKDQFIGTRPRVNVRSRLMKVEKKR